MADFEMRAGDDKILQVTVVDGDGAVVNITGASSIRWEASRSPNQRPPLLAKALGDGVTVIDAAAGRFDVTLDSADTEDLLGNFYHEAELIDGDGKVSTVLAGYAVILPALIKPTA